MATIKVKFRQLPNQSKGAQCIIASTIAIK